MILEGDGISWTVLKFANIVSLDPPRSGNQYNNIEFPNMDLFELFKGLFNCFHQNPLKFGKFILFSNLNDVTVPSDDIGI